MSERFVFHIVLNEVDARDSDCVERQEIRTTGVLHGQGRHPQVVEGLHPLLKDWLERLIFLQINATDLSRTAVQIEIDGNIVVLGFEGERAGMLSEELRN